MRYTVLAANPLGAARCRAADAYMLADMVCTDSHRLRLVAGDSDLAEAVKVLTQARKMLI